MSETEKKDKDVQRMRDLVKSFNSKQEVYKLDKPELNEEKIKEDIARMNKNLNAEEVNENFYSQGGTNAGMTSLSTVDTIISDSTTNGASLRPEEAFKVSLMRTLESGAPINNIGFYDEVNWHLSKLGHGSRNPIDIKGEIFKLIK